MPIREVLQLGNPGLREICEPVSDPTSLETQSITRDLHDTLAHWRATTGYGRAISAPQIGVPRRMVYLNLPGIFNQVFINPSIINRSREKIVVWDACLSFLSIFMQVERHREITVRFQDQWGNWQELKAGLENDLSELLQHEIDHLDGVVALDRITDSKTICTREEFERRYRAESPYAQSKSAN